MSSAAASSAAASSDSDESSVDVGAGSRAVRPPGPGRADRADRKAAKAATKAAMRAKREAGGIMLKRCDLCGQERELLYRCTIDASLTWKFVCAGACWESVSGGVTDGDAAHPHYRYGGTWKLLKR